MNDDSTLGGYFETHQRPPAFEGTDGRAYSVAVYVEETDSPGGGFGAALLFVRWTTAGTEPEGHLETEYLAFGNTPVEAEQRIRALTLHQVKEQLDRVVAGAENRRAW
ncbi:MAG: hypothetical protein HY700_15125 [Gemmatimonadetes bacterium]|nr:hypothetical protein [Gemmatimonadota bacterium]